MTRHLDIHFRHYFSDSEGGVRLETRSVQVEMPIFLSAIQHLCCSMCDAGHFAPQALRLPSEAQRSSENRPSRWPLAPQGLGWGRAGQGSGAEQTWGRRGGGPAGHCTRLPGVGIGRQVGRHDSVGVGVGVAAAAAAEGLLRLGPVQGVGAREPVWRGGCSPSMLQMGSCHRVLNPPK